MGCTASKLDNEDTVRRCKERRRFMKEAVYARHHLAAAHSDYCRSLRITGSALTAFAAGEPLAVSDQSPAILLPNTTNPTPPRVPSPSPPPSSLHTPPPQQQPFSAAHHYNHHRTKTPTKLPHILSESSFSSTPKNQQNPNQNTYNKVKPPIKLPHILSESSISSPPKNNPTNHFHTQKKPKPKPRVKLPHILSDSSISSTPKGQNTRNFTENYTYNANATYSSTPSQASSVWNWENFYPPSPPDSEFFNNNDYKNHQEREIDDDSSLYSSYNKHNPDMETASIYSNYEKKANNHHPNQEVHHHQQHHHIESDGEEEEETETEEREEVQCSEWGDHYSTTSSSSDDEMAERESRSEVGTRSNFGSSVHSEAKAAPFQPPPATPSSKSDKFDDDAGSSVSWNNNNAGRYENEISDMKIVVRHRDLAEIVAALKEYFDKAASAGEQVSEMLETGRAQLDRSFRQLKKTVYHSSGVLSNLSSSWTSKPPLAVKYRFEPGSMDEPGGSKSLCSTLERLLAWEKKLYQEVKAREGVKIEHEKKLSTLQSQEYRGDDEVKLGKTKASIKRLQSLILVTSQAVSTTSSAINGLRDAELVPQLVELCHGFMYMWRSMNQFHEVQNHIVQQVRGLVNRSAKGESTSDLHRQATRDLESAVSAWHSCFCRLIKFQRDFICSLHGWFKLSLIPVNSEPINDNRESSEALSFCDEWKLALDRVPDTVASEAIKSFINVVHSVSMKQAEELKIKKRTESASKELERKASSLRTIEKKYYHSYSMVGIGLPDTGPDNGHALDARDPLSEKKSELAASQRRVEDEMVRHSKAVEVTRAMTLNNIQTGLPGVFQAMTSFSALIMEALEVVCTRSYAIK